MNTKPHQIRQGDVMLVPVLTLPEGCKAIEPEKGLRFVLAHGEVTGHAHAIYEFNQDAEIEQKLLKDRATEIANSAMERYKKQRTVQMWASPDGEWYLEVKSPSIMRHEEHSAPTIPAGVYHCPVQVEANSANMLRIVAD
jgi:hypothetical protein